MNKNSPQTIHLNSKSYLKDGVSSDKQIVVIHGWKTNLLHIEPLSELLSSYAQVYAIDLPGHGKSDVPQDVWGMKEFADSLKGFLDSKGLKKVILVGHSFGGKTIIEFSSLYPEYIDRIVLLGASGIRPIPAFKKRIRNIFLSFLRKLIRFKNTRLGMRIYQNWYIPKFASRDYLNAGPMTKTFVKTVNEELFTELKNIKAPSLLIWGECDDESPPQVGRKMHELIKGSKLILLPGQGHFPYIGSGVGLLSRYIKEFIA